MRPASLLLAHQGGWDEFLMFFIPIALAFGAVKLAEARAVKRREAAADDTANLEP